MPAKSRLRNRVRVARESRGWSQEQLARASGISRAGIGAIESGRIEPSTAAALALAAALQESVEGLFHLAGTEEAEPTWAWPPPAQESRYWATRVDELTRLIPCETTACGLLPHDGRGSQPEPPLDRDLAARTLVLACCDPAAGVLARLIEQRHGLRVIVLPRSSGAALALLRDGAIHAAGLHLATADGGGAGHAREVRNALAGDYSLLRVAAWEEGLIHRAGANVSVRSRGLAWVGREEGSGARRCQDAVLGGTSVEPRLVARDHRGVVEAVRWGWADVGVGVRLAAIEAGLEFQVARNAAYDLCFRSDASSDPRLGALVDVVRSAEYRRLLSELPGYDARTTGSRERVRGLREGDVVSEGR